VWFGAPLAQARLAAIVLHGRDHSPAIIRAMLGDELSPEVAFVAPAAAGGSWYPQSFLAPRAANEPLLGHALERVAQLSSLLAARGVERGRQLLIGFSQGACLACEAAWASGAAGTAVAGVIAFTGGLIGAPGTAWPASPGLDQLALWVSGAEDDPFVPAARMCATAAAFTTAGARVEMRLFPGSDHLVRSAELAGARAMIAALAARHAAAALPG